MERGVAGLAAVVLGITSACGGSRGPTGGTNAEETAALHVSLVGPGAADSLPVQVAVRRVSDGRVYLVRCVETDRPLALQDFCEELLVAPGAYEVVADVHAGGCRSERGQYSALVEGGRTTEVSIRLECGEQDDVGVVVTEQGGPLVTDIDFGSSRLGREDRSACSPLEQPSEAVLTATVYDADTPCEQLIASWSASPELRIDFEPAVGFGCETKVTIDAAAPSGDYEVTLVVSDPDGLSTSFSVPVHRRTCSPAEVARR